MSLETIKAQRANYQAQLDDCESKIQATKESFDQLKIQQQQLKCALFAVDATLTSFEKAIVTEDDDVKES